MKLKWSSMSFILVCLCGLLATASDTARAQIELDKPKNTKPLPSPYTIAASREQIISTAREVLRACHIPFEDQSRREAPIEDKLVTDYLPYADGVTARTDLAHYATLPRGAETRAWTAGRVRLEIRALPLDDKRSQIVVEAFPQGRAAPVVGRDRDGQWVDLASNGRLEDEVVRGLAGRILGIDLSIDRDGRRRILNCEY